MIKNDKFHTKLFDKRDAFNFQIVNFPDLSGNIPNKHSYGVFVSQLIRYARCCGDVTDFTNRTKTLIDKLTKQNFLLGQLRRVFERFAANHYELLFKYVFHLQLYLISIAVNSVIFSSLCSLYRVMC